MRSIETLRRSSLGLWPVVYGSIVLAWLALAAMSLNGASDFRGLPADLWAALCLSAGEASFGPLAVMWGLMVVAMMLPTFVPTLRTFIELPERTGARRTAPSLVAGFIAVWMGAALLGALAQRALAEAGHVSPLGQSITPWLTVCLLAAAGLYQFSALKEACLARCRNPLTVLMEHWRPGHAGALLMGARIGLSCLGCCWALMALAFVGGTMNLIWMALATAFMMLEKLPDIGRPLTRPAGVTLIAAAAYVAIF